MTISEIKTALDNLPRKSNGKRSIPIELRREIVRQLPSSQLTKPQFAEAVGLATSTIHYYCQVRSGMAKKKKTQTVQGFRQVKVQEERTKWVIKGPNGLYMESETLEKVSQLWRALC